MEKINIALVGYGNVGRGVEEATKLNYDEYDTENYQSGRINFRI